MFLGSKVSPIECSRLRIMKLFGVATDIRRSSHLWLHLSKLDLVSRFRGTYLGVIWLLLSQIGTFCITALIWSKLFSVDFNSFFIYIGIGFSIWGFITNSIVGSATSIFSGASTYLNSNTPVSVGASRVVATNFYLLLIGLAIPVSLGIFVNQVTFFNFVFFLFGISLVTVFVSAVGLFVSIVSIKYKDLPQALGLLFQVLFVLTPIIYKTEMLKGKGVEFLTESNPFTWLIYVIRQPILTNQLPEPRYYFYSVIMTIFVFSTCLIFMSRNSRKYLMYV